MVSLLDFSWQLPGQDLLEAPVVIGSTALPDAVGHRGFGDIFLKSRQTSTYTSGSRSNAEHHPLQATVDQPSEAGREGTDCGKQSCNQRPSHRTSTSPRALHVHQCSVNLGQQRALTVNHEPRKQHAQFHICAGQSHVDALEPVIRGRIELPTSAFQAGRPIKSKTAESLPPRHPSLARPR